MVGAGNNPFPGPQPYGPGDSGRFFGREDIALELVDEILSHRVLTVYGPSGAGKSSLLQAAVLPRLIEEEGIRCVTVDAWPQEIVSRSGPVARLTEALGRTLQLGDVREDDLDAAIELAFLVSERPLLLLLDQIEQLLVPHPPEVLESLVVRLAELERWRGGSLHVLITMREDYLGRWSSLLARRPRLIRHSFRVRRMTAPEVTDAVMQTAASAQAPQIWTEAHLAPYIAQMELPGEWRADGVEVETAYVQIVSRQLFAAGGPSQVDSGAAQILEGYLRDSLEALGDLQETARVLLATRFVHGESGRRVQVSREEVRLEVGSEADTDRILSTLENARILRARQHQGIQLFELGHDWLAQPVREEVARQRAFVAAQSRRRRRFLVGGMVLGSALLVVAFAGLALRAQLALAEAEHQAEFARRAEERAGDERDRAVAEREAADRARHEADLARHSAEEAREQSARSRALEELAKQGALEALGQVDQARKELVVALATAETSEGLQRQRAREARDGQRMLAARELAATPYRAAPFLVAIRPESQVSGWRGAAWRLLQHPLAEPVLLSERPNSPPRVASNAQGVWFAAAAGGVVRLAERGRSSPKSLDRRPVEAIDGDGDSVAVVVVGPGGLRTLEVRGPSGEVSRSLDLGTRPVTDLRWIGRSGPVVAVDMAGTTHVLSLSGELPSSIQHGAPLSVVAPADGDVGFITAGTDGTIRRHAHDGAVLVESRVDRSVLAVVFVDGRVIAGGVDGMLYRWKPGAGPPQATRRMHDHFVVDLQARPGYPNQLLSRDLGGVAQLVSFSEDGVEAHTPIGMAHGVRAAAWSDDGRLLVTGGEQGTVTLWHIDDAGRPVWKVDMLAHKLDAQVVDVRVIGDKVVSLDDRGEAYQWSTRAVNRSRVVRAPGSSLVDALSFSPDGGDSLWASQGGSWQAIDGTAARTDRVQRGGHASTPDGRTRAELLDGGRVSVLVDGVHQIVLVDSPAKGRVLALSNDGRRVAMASEDGSIRVWTLLDEAELGDALQRLTRRCALARDRVRFMGDLPAEAVVLERECLERGGSVRSGDPPR
ncbi:MAG: WD40 repeat protein [Kiritimatiellia bacterium]